MLGQTKFKYKLDSDATWKPNNGLKINLDGWRNFSRDCSSNRSSLRCIYENSEENMITEILDFETNVYIILQNDKRLAKNNFKCDKI